MTEKEMLLKIVELQDEIIKLKSLQHYQPLTITTPYIGQDSWNWQSKLQEYCDHDYNYAWNATTPQPCKKCGKPADRFKVTFTNG